MRRSVLCLLVPFALATACGGTVNQGPDQALGDASAADSPGPNDASVPDSAAVDAPIADTSFPSDAPGPDAGPTAFCDGANKASTGGLMADPASVTSSRIVMDCCDGFVTRFHTKAQLGMDLSVMVRSYGLLTAGDYELPADGGNLGVEIAGPDQGTWSGLPASGTLHLQVPPSYDDPTLASFCLHVDAPGDPMDGTRVYASNVVIAPWGWDSRFEVRLLADPSLNANQAAQVPLDSLQLASGDALIRLLSLAWYEASTHTAYWDTWYSSPAIVNQLPPVGVYGLPFVVLADGERVYLGAFMTAVSSVALDMPVIMIEEMQEGSFRIDAGYPGGDPPSPDPRDDPRILSVFASASKLAP